MNEAIALLLLTAIIYIAPHMTKGAATSSAITCILTGVILIIVKVML